MCGFEWAGDDLSSEGSLTLLDSNDEPSSTRSSSRRYTRFCMPIAVSAPTSVARSWFEVRSRLLVGVSVEVSRWTPGHPRAPRAPFSCVMAVIAGAWPFSLLGIRPNHFSPCASGGPTVRSRIFYTLHRFTESFLQLALHPEEVPQAESRATAAPSVPAMTTTYT